MHITMCRLEVTWSVADAEKGGYETSCQGDPRAAAAQTLLGRIAAGGGTEIGS